jgi:uncharacterized Zn-binding protein involved in type VI secretion
MPQGPAARVTDKVVHPLPGVLAGSPGSPTVLIGFLPAWRGLPLAAVAALASAQSAALTAATSAEAAAVAAAATPGGPAARAAAEATKAALLASMGSAISAAAAGGTDIHTCASFPLLPGHGPGVVITGSPTVMINNMPACRLGDTILEAIGPPNLVAMGCMTVLIGDMGSGSPVNVSPMSGAFRNAAAAGTALVCKGPCEACGHA